MVSVLGLSTIKSFYVYYSNKNELELEGRDYFIIGGLSGLFMTQIVLGPKYLLHGSLMGGIYGFFYFFMVDYFVKKKKAKAEKIGLVL